MKYKELSKDSLREMCEAEQKKYDEFAKSGLKLDISRGKPCKAQLDLSMPLLDAINSAYKSEGFDYRNYGLVDGIPEIKTLFASIVGCATNEIIVGGNSSLNMMYDTIARAMQFGFPGFEPWNKCERIKWLCPVPGYDRHFAITQLFNFDMISVPTDENGPIMDIVEEYCAKDPSIKGIWCVPKYSNPTGIVYSDEVVTRLSKMTCAANDFKIFWDNAYFVHSIGENYELKNILLACREAGNNDRAIVFGSTSKITFPGAGVAFMASSDKLIAYFKKLINIQTIGPNKLNQLAHVLYLKDEQGILEIMKKHSEIIKPKFDLLLNLFNEEFDDCDIASWVTPKGGYFISFNVLSGCAKAVCKLCAEAGLILTPAGSTYPYMQDDLDSNIRIAPTFPTLEELEKAGKVFVTCVKLAVLRKLLED